ncbi:DUF636 domain protein [Colletotrichum truncatum]|uniref:DUF636 domain protein n=1 Tax=Colletotrichum truncatum TaxID=5467 RepID=A0ACC3ZB95_COLTU|nr:duf636 domain protein [Colletotrichum truncatum]KAF6787697.1 duf636 domain protein [Colletotrichum truncatum]
MEEDSITITAQCLCKKHKFTASISKSALPLKAACCHCNSCRHTSGALYTSCTTWPSPDEDLSALKAYSFNKNLELFSCEVCSSQIFCRGDTTGNAAWVVTGALQNIPGLVEYATHIFIGDTIDGGASVWLPESEEGKPVQRWREGRGEGEQLPSNWPGPKALSAEELNAGPSPDVTPLWCHCKGVQLSLRSAADLRSVPDEDLGRSFINTKTLKYRGSLECCDSCRMSFGADLLAWTFAPLSHVEFGGHEKPGASQFPRSVSALKDAVTSKEKDPRLGTLAVYNSSPDVERYFCSRCSASVFYAVHDRPDMVDIAVGLLDHPDGARAESLLDWRLDKVGWAQDAAGGWREALADSAKKRQAEWAEATRGASTRNQ